MSGLENATFVIDLDTSQLVAGSTKAKQAFQQMTDSGVQSMQTIQTSADKVVSSNSKVADSAKQSSDTMKASFSSVIAPMTGLVASSASLYFSFDQLERASIRVEQGHLRVEKAQDVVNKLVADGKQGTDQYNQALQNLTIQQERYDVAQNTVNQNMVFMGLSMVTMATSTIPSVIKAVQALRISQEALGVALEATMPWLLAITGAVLAWEYAITPLVKSQTGLDLGIQSNISKLIQQHTQLANNKGSFDDLTGTLGSVDGALSTTTSSFDTLGGSVSMSSSKIKSFKDEIDSSLASFNAMKSLSTQFQSLDTSSGLVNIFTGLSPSGDLLNSENDLLGKIKEISGSVADQRLEFDSLGGSIRKVGTQIQIAYGDEGLQQFLNKINEIGHGGKDQIDDLANSFQKLGNTINSTSSSLDSMKKKASEITTNAFGIPDTTFNQITAGLAKQLGLTQQQIQDSFNPGGAGNAFNPALQLAWEQGNRVFGSVWESLNQGLSRGLPFYEGVGYGGISNSGVNTSTLGGSYDDHVRNMVVDMLANSDMFGTPLSYDNARLASSVFGGAVGGAMSQNEFERDSPQWQKFYALKQAGLFNGDPSLSVEENLANAEKQYDNIFAPLRPDVAAALEAATSSSHSYLFGADNRRPGIRVTQYTYRMPTQDELNAAIADSRFASEIDFQNKLSEAGTKLGLSEKDVINSLANTLTNTDIQAEIIFNDRVSAMSSGTV